MRKSNLIWALCISTILFTGIYIYTNSDTQNKEHSASPNESTSKNDENIVNNIENFQIKTAKATVIEDIESCIELSQIEHQINSEMYEEFLRKNNLSLWTINDYLREMSNDDLELEFRSGNAEAAFVLGMNLYYSSYNTNTTHPDLLKGKPPTKTNNIKILDKSQLNSGRDWLWISALNGVGIALAEISGSYRLESQFLNQNTKNVASLTSKLNALELSYQMLHHEVNSEIVQLIKLDSDSIKKQFIKNEYEEKDLFLKEIKEKWLFEREEMGKEFKINIKIPEEIKKIMNDQQINCTK